MKTSSLLGHIVEVLEGLNSSSLPADVFLGHFFRARKYLGSRDRKFIAESVYGVLRNRRLCEHVLEGTHDVLSGVTGEGRSLFLTAAYLLAIDPSMHILPTDFLELIDEGQNAERLLSALKAINDRRTQTHEELSPELRWSFPDWMVSRFEHSVGSEELPGLLEALNTPAPLTIRVNTIKTTRDECAHRMKLEGIPNKAGGMIPTSLTLGKRMNAFTLGTFKNGWFEVQDEGSQFLIALADPKPTDRVLDMCAGAGGKTLGLAAHMKNRGEIVATDISAYKLKELRRRMRRAGAGNIRVQEKFLSEATDDFFDLVFVDAPCTGVGTIRRNPGMKWSVTQDAVKELALKQHGILQKASEHVKDGGLLLYATCSLFSEENESVVEAFLEQNKDFVLEDPTHRGPTDTTTRAVTGRYVKLMPHLHDTDGFFAAIIRKKPTGA